MIMKKDDKMIVHMGKDRVATYSTVSNVYKKSKYKSGVIAIHRKNIKESEKPKELSDCDLILSFPDLESIDTFIKRLQGIRHGIFTGNRVIDIKIQEEKDKLEEENKLEKNKYSEI